MTQAAATIGEWVLIAVVALIMTWGVFNVSRLWEKNGARSKSGCVADRCQKVAEVLDQSTTRIMQAVQNRGPSDADLAVGEIRPDRPLVRDHQ